MGTEIYIQKSRIRSAPLIRAFHFKRLRIGNAFQTKIDNRTNYVMRVHPNNVRSSRHTQEFCSDKCESNLNKNPLLNEYTFNEYPIVNEYLIVNEYPIVKEYLTITNIPS